MTKQDVKADIGAMKQIAITPSVKKLLKGKNFVSFATVMEDGSPHVAPTWVDYEGDVILINTVIGRVKEKNIRKDPRVALSVSVPENPYHLLIIRGKVFEITTEGAEDHIDQLAKRYFGIDKYIRSVPGEKRVLLKIRPENIHDQELPQPK